MRNQISKWERELWDYVSHGDGDVCPVYLQCLYREDGARCSCPLYSPLSSVEQKTLSTVPCSCADMAHACLPISGDFPCQGSNLSFMEGLRPGRISELICKLAERWLRKARIRRVPVPTDIIMMMADEGRIEIRDIPMKAYSGAIWRVQGTWIIYINSYDSPQQKRVTLFHEAFHLLAHTYGIPVFKKTNDTRGSFNELLGDDFSLQMLMPRSLIVPEWERVRSVEAIAREFDVPVDAARSRVRSLNLI